MSASRRSRRARGWSSVAAVYDRQLALERPALRSLLAMLRIGADEALLDVGTGTGGLLRELATIAPQPKRAVGVDDSPQMLERAAPVPADWALVAADAQRLPFAAASFDLATAAYLLHVLEPTARATVLAEIHRVLRPGGRLGLVTIAPPFARLTWPLLRGLTAGAGPLAGLRPLDPAPDLLAAGFTISARLPVRRGYPSLCMVGRR